MIEHIEYFKTTDGMEFKSVEEALTHELKTNKDAMNFNLVGYDRHDDEPYWEINKDFNNLIALAKDIWLETDYIFIGNKSAFAFISNIAHLLDNDEGKEDILEDTCKTDYKGVGWYEKLGTVFTLLQTSINNYVEDIDDIKSKPIANRDTDFLTYCENKLAELKSTVTNLNKFIKGDS